MICVGTFMYMHMCVWRCVLVRGGPAVVGPLRRGSRVTRVRFVHDVTGGMGSVTVFERVARVSATAQARA